MDDKITAMVAQVMAMSGEDVEPAKAFLAKHGFGIFLDEFVYKYSNLPVEVFADEDGYNFIYQDKKKMYFPKGWTKSQCKSYFTSITMEQDIKSPHCYIQNDNRLPSKDMVVADIGTAEGNFALAVADRAKKLYLFECEDSWIDALKKTFAPYRDKVEIVKAYVSGKDGHNKDADTVTLDTFFADRQIDYIKADIEGAEVDMLKGGRNVLQNKIKKVICCTYHRGGDYETIKAILEFCGFECEHNEGYMLYPYTGFMRDDKPPLLRRGLIFGDKEPTAVLS